MFRGGEQGGEMESELERIRRRDALMRERWEDLRRHSRETHIRVQALLRESQRLSDESRRAQIEQQRAAGLR
jgi:hypothetical protein